jgi:carbon monoxide dehydrogenase subunit G
MHFEHRVTIPADQQRVWQFLLDVPAVGRCVPGVTDVTPLADDDYQGTLKVRLGPVALQLEGNLNVVERNESEGRSTLRVQAADRRAGGSVNARILLQLEPLSADQTALVVRTDANVAGKLGEFGQPLIRKKADQMMDEFARNVQAAVA